MPNPIRSIGKFFNKVGNSVKHSKFKVKIGSSKTKPHSKGTGIKEKAESHISVSSKFKNWVKSDKNKNSINNNIPEDIDINPFAPKKLTFEELQVAADELIEYINAGNSAFSTDALKYTQSIGAYAHRDRQEIHPEPNKWYSDEARDAMERAINGSPDPEQTLKRFLSTSGSSHMNVHYLNVIDDIKEKYFPEKKQELPRGLDNTQKEFLNKTAGTDRKPLEEPLKTDVNDFIVTLLKYRIVDTDKMKIILPIASSNDNLKADILHFIAHSLTEDACKVLENFKSQNALLSQWRVEMFNQLAVHIFKNEVRPQTDGRLI